MVFQGKGIFIFRVFFVLLIFVLFHCKCNNGADQPLYVKQKRFCVAADTDNTVRAKRKVCLLRPDTGPCRADILSWYYDAKKQKCYRFFWGGCQGNGNNFISEAECKEECFLSTKMKTAHTPYFCQLAFDFGTCFGQYNRWTWDHIAGHCRRRLYSGCGGNQNNFETKEECMANCMSKPNNTLNAAHSQLTTCIPFSIAEFN